jgi:hypothetical protein
VEDKGEVDIGLTSIKDGCDGIVSMPMDFNCNTMLRNLLICRQARPAQYSILDEIVRLLSKTDDSFHILRFSVAH